MDTSKKSKLDRFQCNSPNIDRIETNLFHIESNDTVTNHGMSTINKRSKQLHLLLRSNVSDLDLDDFLFPTFSINN